MIDELESFKQTIDSKTYTNYQVLNIIDYVYNNYKGKDLVIYDFVVGDLIIGDTLYYVTDDIKRVIVNITIEDAYWYTLYFKDTITRYSYKKNDKIENGKCILLR